MRFSTLTLLSAFVILAACGTDACGPVVYSPVPAASTQWDGNPCDQSYFDAVACQTAINLGGWYLNGVLVHHYYGGYGYSYYQQRNYVFVQHGGRVTPYSTAVRSVRVSPAPGSSNSASRAYTPPTRNNIGSGSYTPPSRPAQAGSPAPASWPAYTPPTRSYSSPSSSSSYSSPRRK